VGANIGFYSIPFGKSLNEKGGKGKLYCFEPLKSNHEALVRNVFDNDLSDIACIYKIALGDISGTIELAATEKGKTSNAVLNLNDEYVKGREYAIELVEIEKLDSLGLKEDLERCDFIKVDIEGAEFFFISGGYLFISGGYLFITKFRPMIYAEFNPFFMEKFNCSFLDAWRLLEPLGYACFAQKRHSSYFEAISPKVGLANVLLIPEEYDRSKLVKVGLIRQ